MNTFYQRTSYLRCVCDLGQRDQHQGRKTHTLLMFTETHVRTSLETHTHTHTHVTLFEGQKSLYYCEINRSTLWRCVYVCVCVAALLNSGKALSDMNRQAYNLHTHTHTHTLIHSHSLSLTHTHSLSLTRFLSLSHTHTHRSCLSAGPSPAAGLLALA